MNMFKSRRKAKDQSEALEALTNIQSPPSTYKTVKNLKRKNKNIPEDPKPVFDLSTALPDADDFRTSLLMSNLSARFSMLREQDDPNSKIGKASDDSVLFPKRASRLNLFNHNPLADLAEVESIYSAIRPPFTERERSNSFGDGYDSESGSVMNRYRPGEGNTLFGGRQKFYKIPTSSARNVMNTDVTTPRKQLYENDSSMIQIQQNTKNGKDAIEIGEVDEAATGLPSPEVEGSSEIASPATTFSKNRGTQSSTTSAPRRSSTAATSVASESVRFRNSNSTEDEVPVKSTDRHSHVSENLSTLSISKTRDNSIPTRLFSQTKKSGFDKSPRPLPIYNSPSLRNASTPILPANAEPLDFGFKSESRSTSATGRYQTDSPTPSLIPESDDVLAHNVQPGDRGKATALGLFNKPAREFDEYQFNQRQLKMHEGQVASMSSNSRSISRASNEGLRARSNSNAAFTNHSQVAVDTTSTPQIPPIPSAPDSPMPGSRRTSKASGRGTPPLRPRSKSSGSVTAVTNVKLRIESLIRKQNAELAAMEAEKLGMSDAKELEDPSENKENHAEAFFNDDDSDADESNGVNDSRANSSQIVDESHIHPAFRNSYRISDDHSRKSNYSNFSRTRSVVDDGSDNSRLQVPKPEADLNVPQIGIGLSGLIRTHLRQDSDKSSIVARPDSSIAPSVAEPSQRNSMASTARTAADSLRSDPFDLDLNRGVSTPRLSQAPLTPTTAMSQVAQQFLSRAMAIKDTADKEATLDSTTVEDNGGESSEQKPWHEDLEPKHQRGGSSETTKERREFDEVLAARRRKIREGMKSVNERDRSQSPATASRGQSVTMQAFVQQRAVTDPQPKAMKMLGLQNNNGSSKSADTDRGRHMGLRNEHRGRTPDTDHNKQQTITYSRFDPEPAAEREPPTRSATPPAIRHGRRDRSNSNVGHRSKSRTAQREANVPMPVAHDYFSSREETFTSPSTETREMPESNGNRRNGYQGPRMTPTEITTKSATNHTIKAPALSPTKSFDSPLDAGRPAMGTYSAGRTPPSSGRATPTGAFNRKRSVTKTMISEPTFVSSTSSVPLVRLPEAQQNPTISIPPLPMMNPRRRGNTTGESPIVSPAGPSFSRSPLEPVPASPVVADFGSEGITGQKMAGSPSPRKLRKANSEGGSMAAKARHQAMAAELTHEKTRSPPTPMFASRSATSLGMTDGGMF